ncbi:endonuclease [Candidatus Peregrinibacteria bacterium CG10_big_fil_rev_8_21_14_0_10_49_16]|nr:MAG: endonuclease [Candidatus Peregrinibacteria bacterium CG22_combo_CG10-13_8_21_14_all_49_11]PIR51976.1 MAG: endonuclease [Candidatus Peregrinibacteria bacterium CG10_big_fil_rev_8_21_14_0_10_49_16]
MAYVYFLFSEKDQGWYIGCTSLDVHERLCRHLAGTVRSTKWRRPLLLAYFEEYVTNSEARKREWYLKKPSGYLEKLVITRFLLWNKLSWPRRGPLRD